MVRIHGTLVSVADGAPVEHYQVLAGLRFLVPVDGGEAFQVFVSGSARASADGRFQIEVDAEGEPRDPIDLLISAPSGVLVHRAEVMLDALAEPLQFRIEAERPFTIEESDLPGLGQRLRVTGRVIDEAGATVPADLPVVIWGVGRADGSPPPPRPLLIAQTQAGGAFGGDWPPDEVAEAFGRVDGGPPVPVPLDGQSRIVREILLVTRVSAARAAECECAAPPARAPDAVDLAANPAAFSQDLGGGCVDLTVPNRALEEFSYFFVVRTSEPRVTSLTLGGRRKVPRDLLVDLLGVSLSAAALRGDRLASANLGRADLQLDVDTARRLVQADAPPRPETIERAAWLSEVAHVKTQIDTVLRTRASRRPLDADSAIAWDHRPTIYPAIDVAHGHLLHYKEVWRADGYSLGDLLYSLPLAPGQRRQVAVLDWERRERAAREERLEFEEALDALIERDRDVREIVGSELHETVEAGSRNTTWGVAAGIGAGFIGSGFGIFGGIAGGASGSDSEAWQNSARQFSADSLQQLRDRVGQRASSVRSQRSTVVQTVAQGEAVRAETEVVANYNRCHAITVAYFEVLRHFLVTHELADVQECLFVPFPLQVFDRGKALRWRQALGRYLKDRSLLGGFDAIERIADSWVGWDFPQARYSEEAPTTLEGELRISFVLPRPRDAADGAFQLAEWEAYRDVLPLFARDLWGELLEKAVAANKSATAARDEVFRRDIAPRIAVNLVNRLRFAYVGADGGESEVPLDASLVSAYRENQPLYVTLQPAGALPPVPREDIAYFKIEYTGTPLPPEAQVIVHAGRLRYTTDHITALLFDDARILDDLRGGDPVLVGTPTAPHELRNPRAADLQLADRLVAHLDDHLEFYHQVLWHALDPQRRYLLLDAIEVPGQQGRSVASLCTNELLGIIGNSLVLPVAPGQRLNPSVTATDARGNPVAVRHAYATPPSPPLRVTVPTRGVYTEAVAGACNACEPIDDTRYWRWRTEGLLAPPEIEPVDTGTRASAPPDLTPTPLPAPLVSIQNAPEAPDPFGLAAAFGLLSRPELFRDITGLEGTQKNALSAFDAALSAASAIGGEAAKLARQNELSKTSARMVDRIQQALADELLTPEAARRLTESVLGGLVGREEPAAEAPAQDAVVEKAVDQLAQAGSGSLKVEGPSETVELSFDQAAPAVGGGSVVTTHPDLPAPHDSTGVRIMPELAFEAHDITPFVIEEREVLRAMLGSEFDKLEQAGLLLPGATPSSYRLRRRLHIVYPAESASSRMVAGTDRLPLVVLQHGAHGWRGKGGLVDSHTGYRYLQDELARHGIVSVSVDANVTNAFTAPLLDTRAQLVISALDTLFTLSLEPSSVFHNRLDFSRVGLFGHSRGGDAVIAAARSIASRFPRPLYIVKFVCALAPTDLSGQARPDQRLALTRADCPFLTILHGTMDGDVSGALGANSLGGTGFRHYDRARTHKSMVLLDACGHNRFNRAWMQDTGDENGILPVDRPALQTPATHEELLKEYVGALARWHLLGDTSGKTLFDGQQMNKAGVSVSVQWSFGTAVEDVDDMEAPRPSRTLTNASIAPFADVQIGGRSLELETSHQTRILVIPPSPAAPTAAAMVLDLPSTQRNWKPFRQFTLRATAHFDLSSPDTILQGALPEFDVVIRDASRSVTLDPFPTVGSKNFPVFHRGLTRLPDIKSASRLPGGGTRLETRASHTLVAGDRVFIQMEGAASSPLNGAHQVVTVEGAARFRVAASIPADLGAGRFGKFENYSVHRLETLSYLLPPLDVVLGTSAIDLGDIRSVEIRPRAGYAQHVFIDSLELIEP